MLAWLKRHLRFLITIAVSVVFAALFLLSVDLDSVVESLGDADYAYVAPALALFAVSVAARGLRWRCFLLPASDLTWRQLLPSVLIGYACNNPPPRRAGGRAGVPGRRRAAGGGRRCRLRAGRAGGAAALAACGAGGAAAALA